MTKKTLNICLLALAILLIPQITFAKQIDFYVAPNGSDNNPGTKRQPFQTLEKAKNMVASIIPSMTDDITVYFKGGNYFIKDAVVFTPADDGTNNHHVIYQAYKEETPVFSGATKLSNWTKFNDKI